MEDINDSCGKIVDKNDKKNEENVEDKNNIVIYLIGNKIDFLNDDNTEKKNNSIVTREEKDELKNNLGFQYYEISNKWNINIDEVLSRIVLDCVKNVDNKIIDKSKKSIKSIKEDEKKCCS